MFFSYVAFFAALTLRILLSLSIIALGEGKSAYRIVVWICWNPNMIAAYFIIKRTIDKPKPISN